jgi:hypothetical protein
MYDKRHMWATYLPNYEEYLTQVASELKDVVQQQRRLRVKKERARVRRDERVLYAEYTTECRVLFGYKLKMVM